MRLIQHLMFGFFAILLSACGGGGTLESGGTNNGGGSSQDNFQLSLVLLNSSGQEVRQVSATEPGTLRATLRRNGQPFSNQLIRFNLDGNVGVLSPTGGSARTDASGIATIQLLSGENAGSGQVTARFDASSTQVVASNPFVFDAVVSAGLNAQLSLTLTKHDGTNTREVSHFSPAIAEARLLIDGSPAAFQLINFQLGALGVLNPGNGSAMTDANGIARIDVIAGTEAGASSITATFSLSTQQTTTAAPYVFTTAGDSPVQGDGTAFNINLVMSNASGAVINQVSNNTPGIVKATVTDSLGQPVTGQVVSFTSTLGRIQPAFGTALTNSNGEATVTLTAGTIEGAGTIQAQYQARTQTLGFTSAGNELTSPYQLSISLVNTSGAEIRRVSRVQPGVARALLTRNGLPVVNQLVNFSLSSELGQIFPASGTAKTNENGIAEISLLAGQVAGAGQLNATVSFDSEVVNALPFVFETLGDDQVVTAISLSLLDAGGLPVRDVAYATPRVLQAVVTENGAAAAFKVVTFRVEGAGEINPTTGRAMTDANGIARVDLRAGFVAGAGEAFAQYSNSAGAQIVSDAFAFTSQGDTPIPGTNPEFTIGLTLTDGAGNPITEISQATPGTITALVRTPAGAPVVNQVVTFSSTLGRIQPAFGTALTNAQGEAQIRLTAGTIEGAGVLTARYEGVSQTFNFTTRGNEGVSSYQLTLSLVDSDGNAIRQVSRTAPGRLQAVLSQNGQPVANQLVSFSLSSSIGVLSPASGAARTNASGIAELALLAGQVAGSGQANAEVLIAGESLLALPFIFDSLGDDAASRTFELTLLDDNDVEVRNVAYATPRRLRALVLVNEQPQANKLVSFAIFGAGNINPSGGLAVTDASGWAEVILTSGTIAGGGEARVSYITDEGSEIISQSYAYTSAGDQPFEPDSDSYAIQMSLTNAAGEAITVVSQAEFGIVTATVTTFAGEPVVNKVVSFSSTIGRISPAIGTALTDAQGRASIRLTAGNIEGAGTVTAIYSASTQSVAFTTLGNEITSPFRIVLSLDSVVERTVSRNNPGVIRATVTDNGQPVVNQLVNFSLASNIGLLSPSSGTARTDSSGVASLTLLAGSIEGTGQVNAQLQINGFDLLATPFVFDSLGDDQVVSTISVDLLDAAGLPVRDVAFATPRVLQAVVTENGAAAAFKVVTFRVEGAGEINPTTGRAMTDVNGIARVDLRAGFVAGAGEAFAQYSNSAGAQILSDAFAFTSQGDTPVPGTNPEFTIGLTLTDGAGNAITEISQATPGTVTALVRTQAGAPVVNQVVTFSSTLGRIQPAFGTALTNAQGEAQIRLTAGTIEGAGVLTARYQGVTQTISYTTRGNEIISQYLLTLEMRDSTNNISRNVSKDNQGRLIATLSFDGIPLANQLVTFELANGVGELVPSIGTARTDDNGVAELRLFAGAVPGAGIVTASYQAVDETVLSLPYVFESNGDQSAETLLSIQIVDVNGNEVRDVDFANPRRVEVTLEQGGIAAPFKLVTIESRFAGIINPSSGRVMTDANGSASIDLLAGFEQGAGEVQARFVSDSGVVILSDAYTFVSAGDTPVQGNSPDFTIGLQLISTLTNTETSEVAANNPGQIAATVLDNTGQPVINRVVSFSTSLGALRPATGTALTDALGVARITLAAGTAEGAGTITAQFEAISETIGFYTRGDEVDPNQLNAAIDFRLLTNCPSDFRSVRNPALCSESTSISADEPGILFITVTRQGTNTPLAQTLVSGVTTIGAISPRTGTAITDINGVALLDLVAGRDVGAGEVTISAANTNRTKAFEIGAVEVEIAVSSSLGLGETLSAGSTALISVEITRNGAVFNPPLAVEFTSGCVQAGLAVIDEAVTSIGGIARSTYRAAGCVGPDLITATVITGGNTVSGSVTVNVSEAALGSIEFLDVSAPVLALKGTGGANRTETSVVRFRLVDANGNAVAGREVNFALTTAVGGLELAQLSGFTNIEGIVQTVVRSGIVPTPVRVLARSEQVFAGAAVVVTAPSDVLSVSTGLADQNSFSLSRSAFNVHALDFDGNEVDVTVFLADHFNNPVPDGTAVNFITEGGSIEPSCTTENGRCVVKWRSQNPRPFTAQEYENSIDFKCDRARPCPFGIVRNETINGVPVLVRDNPLGGRATITAYAVGQESFSDLNGNGRFDQGEFVLAYDLTEAFTDHNEDGVFGGKSCADASDPCSPANSNGDEFEEFIDFNSNGQFDGANGLYDGLLCREEDAAIGICTRELVNIFQNQVIVMSGDQAFFRLVTYAQDCSNIPGVVALPVQIFKDGPAARENNSENGRFMCEISSIDLSVGNAGATPPIPEGASSVPLQLFIADRYNNPLPVGTTVSITTDNGVLFGTTSYTFPNTVNPVPVSIFFGLTREPPTQGNDRTEGLLNISVTATSGLVSTFSIEVRDDR